MKSGSWKAAENRFARDMGTNRKPCDGSRAGADWETTMFCFQLKYRNRFPGSWWEWLSGIVAKAAESGRIGVLVLNKPRGRDQEALVVVRWADWVALHGEPVIDRDALKGELTT